MPDSSGASASSGDDSEVAGILQRAGVRADADQIAAAANFYRGVQRGLERLREHLNLTHEPAWPARTGEEQRTTGGIDAN